MPDAQSHPATTPCPVRIELSDGSSVNGILWLLPDPSRASGSTSLESLLDGTRDFLAIGLNSGGSQLISRHAIRTVEAAASGPGTNELDSGSASLDVLTLRLDSGQEISGVLRAVAPDGANRMSDIFNAPGRFIGLGVGDRYVLASKRHIVRVSF
ncbi:MAG: hypothetical protein ABIT01_14600 [Thermoanaerobaculia bacterium]